MKRNILFILASLAFACIVMSCGDDDDNSSYDREWKAYNDKLYYALIDSANYTDIPSKTGDGSIYMKRFTDENSPFKTKISDTGYPTYGDSVVVRYVGWYFNLDGTPVIFDGTENKCTINGKDYNLNFNKQGGIEFGVAKGIIDGWITALYRMKDGDAANIAIPYKLGYGAYGLTNNYTTVIPGYTTLWFNIKMVKVIPSE